MKQETLKEAAENYINDDLDLYESLVDGHISYNIGIDLLNNLFISGAKWQAERMYSYDELRRIAYNAYCLGQLENPTESKYNIWVQQFKNK
jgi:hypothetical protein